MSDHLRLTQALRAWPREAVDQTQFQARPYQRLANALRDLQAEDDSVGPGDIAGLIRTVLMRETADTGNTAELIVPRDATGFPEKDEWEDYGIVVNPLPPKALRIWARPWSPAWLDGCDERRGIDSSAYDGSSLVHRSSIPTDPALKELVGEQYSVYSSPGQAMAVRSAFLMDAGETLLVNLPTGQGKSLVFQGPARKGGVSVLVVPTTALAKDHERRFWDERWADGPIAYHGGLSDEEKQGFRARIRDGSQLVVAASPEAVLTGLRRPLEECAEAGALSYFIVDEAHIVDQWGTEFRPEYQYLAAFRNLLKHVSPHGSAPKTLLLSATVTEEVFRTLQRLFGDFHHVSAVHLRPEIEFWIKEASNRGEKIGMLREAVRQLPRPFILYACTVADAEAFYQLVRQERVRRVRKVVGGTDLEGILQAWSGQHVDVIVATSAFGLGVDNTDVRAVVHACIPESADRFYQEVGRGGRDGKSSISLTIFEDADWRVAKNLSRKKVIRDQGWPHWKKLWSTKQQYEEQAGVYLVDLRAQPPNVFQESDANQHWNKVTLSLTARAGVIDLEARLTDLSPLEMLSTDEERKEYWERSHNKTAIRVNDFEAANDREVWERRVLGERQRAQVEERRSFDALREIFGSQQPINDILKAVYSYADIKVHAPVGRCPATRAGGRPRTFYVPPCPVPPALSGLHVTGYFARRENWPVYLTYDEGASTWQREVVALIEIATKCGFLEVLAPPAWLENKKIKTLHRSSPKSFVILRDALTLPCPHQSHGRGALKVPQVVVVPPGMPADKIVGTALAPPRATSTAVVTPQIVIFEKDMLFPEHDRWRFHDHVPVLGTVKDFFTEVSTWRS